MWNDISFLVPAVNEYFKDIIEKYSLDVSQPIGEEIHLRNAKYTLVIYSIGRHGFTLLIKFIDLKTKKEYELTELIHGERFSNRVKIYNRFILNKEERAIVKSIENEYHHDFCAYVFTLKHFEKYLEGNFE